MASLSLHKLPILHFTDNNLEPSSGSWSETCDDVTKALEKYGCFIAAYNKVPSELRTAFLGALKDLFDLPTQTKIQNKSTRPLNGYVGQIPFIPLYESMGIDFANTLQGIQKFTSVMWPNGNQDFSETVLEYTKIAAELEQTVVKMVYKSYGIEKYYESYLDSTTYLSRVMKYSEPKTDEPSMGFVPHTDKSFLTILYQTNEVNGLEIQAKDGKWFEVEFIPSSFVVMAGDAAMAWSNNRIHSPKHRVTMKGKEARYSTGQFTFLEGVINIPEELVDAEHPLQFKSFNHLEFFDFYGKEENRKLECAIRTYCGI